MVGLQSLDLPIGVRIPVSQPKSMDGWHETEVRVRYAETDQMGIVHHANYLVWFEIGRSDCCHSFQRCTYRFVLSAKSFSR